MDSWAERISTKGDNSFPPEPLGDCGDEELMDWISCLWTDADNDTDKAVVKGEQSPTPIPGHIAAVEAADPPRASTTATIRSAIIDYNPDLGAEHPINVSYGNGVSVSFERDGCAVKSVRIENKGETLTWESHDGKQFSLRGRPDATAGISYEKGLLVINSKIAEREERLELHPDGSQLRRYIDSKNHSWTTVSSSDGNLREEISVSGGGKIVREHDCCGLQKVAVIAQDGKPILLFLRIDQSIYFRKIDLTKPSVTCPVGTLELDDTSPEPRFSRIERVEGRDGTDGERKQLLKALQDTLLIKFPETQETKLMQLQRDHDRKFHNEVRLLGLPLNEAAWSQEHLLKIDQLKKKIQEELELSVAGSKTHLKARLESVESERRLGKFGPATRQMYQEYVDWIQTEGVPAYQRLQARFSASIPGDCPRPLPRPAIPGSPDIQMDPLDAETFRARGGTGDLPPVNLGIDTNKDDEPDFAELEKLGKAMLWMSESREALERVRLDYEVTTLLPDVIARNGFPEGWHIRHYEDTDRRAYREAFRQASDRFIRARNYIVSAIDSDKLNLMQSHNWASRTVEEIRLDLELPSEWNLTIDPVTKKVKSIHLDLPDRLDRNDPTVKEKLERVEKWLAGPGKRIERALEEAATKEADPDKFLFWGTTELPPGSKFKDQNGNEKSCNVLQCDFEVASTKDGRISIKYSIQPQNAHIFSYQNLPIMCSDVGAPFVDERTYDPEDFVIVRQGMEGVQMVKAKHLQSWKLSQKGWYYGEKGLVAAMDIGMVVTGTVELRALRTAERATASQSIKMTGRELVLSRRLAKYRIALGGTGAMNNAYVHESGLGRTFLEVRGLAMLADVAAGLPAQLRSLAGAAQAGRSADRLGKLEKAIETLSLFTRGAEASNKIQMTVCNFLFAPLILKDISRELAPDNDMRSALDGLRAAERLLNADKAEAPASAAGRRLRFYVDKLALTGEQLKQADELIRHTLDALRATDPAAKDLAARAVKIRLGQYLKTEKNIEIRLVAAAALLSLSGDPRATSPDGEIVVQDSDRPAITRLELETFLDSVVKRANTDSPVEPGTADRETEPNLLLIGANQLLAMELLVQLGGLSPMSYGRALKRVADSKEIASADLRKQWVTERSGFIELAVKGDYAPPSQELEAAATTKLLETYRAQISENTARLRENIAACREIHNGPSANTDDYTARTRKLGHLLEHSHELIGRYPEIRQELDWIKRALDLRLRDPSAYNRLKDKLDASIKTLLDYHESHANETEVQLRRIAVRTDELLTLLQKNPQAYERQVDAFKRELIGLFRSGDGQAIADEEARVSTTKGVLTRLSDNELRARDVRVRGPVCVNFNLQAAAAVALLMLSRGSHCQLDLDSVAAARSIVIPGYSYIKVTVETPRSAPSAYVNVKRERLEVAARTFEQSITVKDLLAILNMDATSRTSGSRRLVSGDILFNSGALDYQVYAAILKDTISPAAGMKPGTKADIRWALDRLGIFANAQRAKEAHQLRTMSSHAREAAEGTAFGVSSQDLTSLIRSVAQNSRHSGEIRARAAFILRALEETPDDCLRMLRGHHHAGAKGRDYDEVITTELRKQLTHEDPSTACRAARALDTYEKISKGEFNEVMLRCIRESADPSLRANALTDLKLEGPDDLSIADRTNLLNMLKQQSHHLNEGVQIALLRRIQEVVTPEDLSTTVSDISDFIHRSSVRYARRSTELRAAAVAALGNLNYRGSQDSITRALSEDPSAKVRLAAMQALVAVSPAGLAELLDKARTRETDPSAREYLDRYRFSAPRETDEAVFKQEWERHIESTPSVWFKPGTSANVEQIRRKVQERFGTVQLPGGEHRVLLLDLDEVTTADWTDHQGTWAGRRVGDIGRGLLLVGSLGFADVDIDRYDDRARHARRNAHTMQAHRHLDMIIDEANGSSPDDAIVILSYIARNNGAPLSKSLESYAQKRASTALIDLAKAGGANANLAMRELISSIHDQDIDVEVRLRYLTAIKEMSTSKSPTVSKHKAAHAIFQAMSSLLWATKSDQPSEPERQRAVLFWNSCLDTIEELDPRGYLGPHYPGGAVPILRYMANNHPFPEVRIRADALVAKLQDSALYRFAKIRPQSGLEPKDAAQSLNAALADSTLNPDKIVDEIARTCKAPPLILRDDARIQILRNALEGNSEKIKVAAAKVLLDRDNSGVQAGTKIAAVEALARVHAGAIYHRNTASSTDADHILNEYFKHSKDAESGMAFEREFRLEKQRLLELPLNREGRVETNKRDGSRLVFNGSGQIRQIQYPQFAVGLKSVNLVWAGKNELASIQHPSGETWRREVTNGTFTHRWVCNGKTVFEGNIEVRADGTLFLTRTKHPLEAEGRTQGPAAMGVSGEAPVKASVRRFVVARGIIWTNGDRSTVELNAAGKPARVLLPSGKTLEYVYDSRGNLARYGGSYLGGRYYDVHDGLEVSGNPPQPYTTEVHDDGSISYTNNEGFKCTIHIDGAVTRIYTGPPRHLFTSSKQLQALLNETLDSGEAACLIRQICQLAGDIKDKSDPRIPILLEASRSCDQSLARTAAELLESPRKLGLKLEPLKRPKLDS